MSNSHLDVKELQIQENITVSGNPDMDNNITIERCPHDEENPYTMIRNGLIRETSISTDCIWLIIYLLSNKAGWKINVKQIINHLKGRMGRDRIYEIINEAIESGYMKRVIIKKGNISQQVNYFISETPKFKKCFRHPGSQDPESRDTENQEHKKKYTKEETYIRNNTSLKVSSPDPIPIEPAKAESAKASEVEVSKKRTPSDFSPKIRDVGQKILDLVTQAKPDWPTPKVLFPFLTQVEFMIRLDKRDPQKLLDVLAWALSDSFWFKHMLKPNPAKYLREKYDQLDAAMNSKPAKKERKFAPCSTGEVLQSELYKEFKRTAL